MLACNAGSVRVVFATRALGVGVGVGVAGGSGVGVGVGVGLAAVGRVTLRSRCAP